MLPLGLSQAGEWVRALTDFDGAYKSVSDNNAALERIGPKVPRWPKAMQDQYRALRVQGAAAFARLASLKATRDKVRGWLSSAMQAARSAVGLSSLGVLPLVYVAVGIGAFVAAIAVARSFLSDAAGFAQRLKVYEQTQRDLVEQGVDPAEAARRASTVAEKVAGAAGAPGFLERLGSKALWIGGGIAVLVYFGPRLLDAVRKR